MSQQEVEMLKALIRQKERERLELESQLSKAQSSASTTGFGSGAGLSSPQHQQQKQPHQQHQQPALSISTLRPHPLNENGVNGPSRSSTMSHRATPTLGLTAKQARQDHGRPMKRSKTTHAAANSATASMVRSRSSFSSTAAHPNPNPFVAKGTGPITPPCPPLTRNNSVPVAVPGVLSHYLSQNQCQQPSGAFIQDNSSCFLPAYGQPQHVEIGREMDPAEFLSMHDEDEFTGISPISIPSAHLLSPLDAGPYPSSSLPSTCGSLTSAPTIETAMSRCNSTMNDNASISGQFSEMVRIQSQQSARSHARQDSLGGYNQTTNHPPLLGKRSSAGSEFVSRQANPYPYPYASSAPAESGLSQHQHAMQQSLSQESIQSASSVDMSPEHDTTAAFLSQHLSMERSVSKDSIRSNSSLKHRAKEALARQNGNAAKSRHLQPKPAVDPTKPTPAEPASGGKGKDGKAVIAKAKYERPKHPKVMCNQCNDHPEGFRGEHELRRHTEAKHKSMVRKWICRDPALAGIPHSETAVKPLKDCKQCSANKQYGAYYNAAAHLRRTHFKVKPRKGAKSGPGGGGGPDEEREKRGGKGGGDWPSMNELKNWMIEVTVPMDQAGALVPDLDGNESVGAPDPEDYESEFVDAGVYGSSQQMALPVAAVGADGHGHGYDLMAFAGVGGGLPLNPELDMAAANNMNLNGPLPGLPGGELDSSSFLLGPGGPPLHQQGGVPLSASTFGSYETGLPSSVNMMSVGVEQYSQPLSSSSASTAGHGITYANLMHVQGMHPHPHEPGDDLPDLPFELTFAAGGQ